MARPYTRIKKQGKKKFDMEGHFDRQDEKKMKEIRKHQTGHYANEEIEKTMRDDDGWDND